MRSSIISYLRIKRSTFIQVVDCIIITDFFIASDRTGRDQWFILIRYPEISVISNIISPTISNQPCSIFSHTLKMIRTVIIIPSYDQNFVIRIISCIIVIIVIRHLVFLDHTTVPCDSTGSTSIIINCLFYCIDGFTV